MAFAKKRVDDRKRWLSSFVPGTYLDQSASAISYQDFVHKVRSWSVAPVGAAAPQGQKEKAARGPPARPAKKKNTSSSRPPKPAITTSPKERTHSTPFPHTTPPRTTPTSKKTTLKPNQSTKTKNK